MCYSFPQILYVDSDSDSCEIVRMMLQQADGDYEVTTLNSAEEAAEMISSRSFDLYIFDQPWRNPSGLDLCRTVRKHDGKAPILIFSVMSRHVDRQKGMMAGATEYLVKLEDINDLTSTVKRLLDGRGTPAGAN